nr:LacI family DNA-binding transcriptional regulator [Bacilli bacterium]
MTTRHDVAKRAGVSPSTVSRVINESGYVAQEVRLKVEKAIEELHYVPNRIARSLRLNESMQIACITHNITNPFYSEIVVGLESELFQQGYTLSLYTSNFSDRDYQRTIAERMFDGVVVLSPVELSKMIEIEQIQNRVPIAVYWDFSSTLAVPGVTVDLCQAMQNATEYLIDSGHERIIFLGHETLKEEENPRFLGYLKAHRARRLPIRDEHILTLASWADSPTFGYQKMMDRLQHPVTFTAVVAANDLLAFGAMRALHEKGYRIPEDVSVIGFDDVDLAQLTIPSLTTVHLPTKQIGEELARLIVAKITGIKIPSSVVLSSSLVIRETVAPVVKKVNV